MDKNTALEILTDDCTYCESWKKDYDFPTCNAALTTGIKSLNAVISLEGFIESKIKTLAPMASYDDGYLMKLAAYKEIRDYLDNLMEDKNEESNNQS